MKYISLHNLVEKVLAYNKNAVHFSLYNFKRIPQSCCIIKNNLNIDNKRRVI